MPGMPYYRADITATKTYGTSKNLNRRYCKARIVFVDREAPFSDALPGRVLFPAYRLF